MGSALSIALLHIVPAAGMLFLPYRRPPYFVVFVRSPFFTNPNPTSFFSMHEEHQAETCISGKCEKGDREEVCATASCLQHTGT